jgi:TPR repeat protein
MAADDGNTDGANGVDICMDMGDGIDQDTVQDAKYYPMAALQKLLAEMANLGGLSKNWRHYRLIKIMPEKKRICSYVHTLTPGSPCRT